MLVPIARFAGGVPDTFVRLVLTVQVGLTALGAWQLGRVRRGAMLAFAALALVFWFTKVFVNGLESALELVLLASAIAAAERKAPLRVGLLAGLLTLARLSAFFGGAMLLVATLRRASASPRTAVGATGALAAPIAVFFAYQLLRFGHAMPVSAAIKYGAPISVSVTALAVLVGAVVATLAVVGRVDAPVWLAPLVVWIAAQSVVDAFVRRVVVPEIWYLVPHATLLVLMLAPRWSRAYTVVTAAVALVAMTLRVQPASYATYVGAKETGEWLARETPPSARIAGWDCGIAAFYSGRRFSNLDGLASSWDFKLSYLDRGRVRQYLDDRAIEYVAQYERADAKTIRGLDDATWELVYARPFSFTKVVRPFDLEPARWLIVRRR